MSVLFGGGDRSENRRSANVRRQRGSLEALGAYLQPRGGTGSFLISGGGSEQRHQPLTAVFRANVGVNPVLVAHDHCSELEALARRVRDERCTETGRTIPFCALSDVTPGWEPFYGMTAQQAVRCLRRMAEQTSYPVSPAFERVADAHLAILRLRNIPASLTGLNYLANVRDMGRLRQMVMGLPCGPDESRRLWSDLCVDGDNGRDQFDLLRLVVRSLAEEAEQSGWRADTKPGSVNFLTAMKRGATVLLDVNAQNARMVSAYIAEELRLSGERRFLLLLDGVPLTEPMCEFLQRTNGAFGIVSDNVLNAAKDVEKSLSELAERAGCVVLFKHNTGPTAERLAKLFGTYERIRESRNEGSSRGRFDFFSRGYNEGTSTSLQDDYRVRPEEILRLGPWQAIVLDADTDEIIHYN